MSIIPIVDKNRSLSIKVDTNQSTIDFDRLLVLGFDFNRLRKVSKDKKATTVGDYFCVVG